MSSLFVSIFVVSTLSFTAGLINPKWVLPKAWKSKTRLKAAKIYSGMALASFALVGVVESVPGNQKGEEMTQASVVEQEWLDEKIREMN
ncbi:MAG: hypothetical protein AAFQ89_08515 [Cyanobacteria bacterium J06626_18]